MNREEKHLEHIYDLMELYDFDRLSIEDQKLVLSLMTIEEYQLRRQILAKSLTVFETEYRQPKPLILPTDKSGFLTKTVPLYHVFGAVAASFMIFIALIPFLRDNEEDQLKEMYITQVDTVYVEHERIDTVVEIKEKVVYVDKEIKLESVAYADEEPRLLEVGQYMALPPLNSADLMNKGNNMKQDPTNELILDYSLVVED